MADKIPLKLVDAGSGVGQLAEMASGDTVPLAQLAKAVGIVLAALVAGSNTPITTADTIQTALQNLQAQVSAVVTSDSGKAAKGANSDITSLSGLTTALSLLQGGTGVTTIAALLTALITAGAYAKSNIVGVVGQTSGVPTGAAFETGGNTAGQYIRTADGTQICWRVLSVAACSTATGNIFRSAAVSGGSLPAAFISAPYVAISGTSGAGGGWAASDIFGGSTTWGSYSVRNATNDPNGGNVYVIAIGRWF